MRTSVHFLFFVTNRVQRYKKNLICANNLVENMYIFFRSRLFKPYKSLLYATNDDFGGLPFTGNQRLGKIDSGG